MQDYGHELQFGSFLTPTSTDPDQLVRLAQHCEEVGLDLVTFQDHPYQPAFLDTWTLLSFVAARTARVRLAPNVLNLPLRNPAIIAKSVASLDRLSQGRVELGLGAGAFWDAIVAMGTARLSPGASVTAVEEAIDVIRGLWDVTDGSRLEVAGTHHRLDGAKRGPAPAHEVNIWLGAYQPRMLRLVGRKADGWLPSLSYLAGVDQLAEAGARIDAAAREAGRDPGDIRRLLNINGTFTAPPSKKFLSGSASQWAEQLADLALGFGMSTFILGSDDERTLAVFGREVAPATRELVAAERG